MSRIILQGSPSNLYRLQRSDLPRDNDLSHSFWRYVDFSGFDLSAYDLTDMDVLDCDGSGSTLGAGKTGYMMSRNTSWDGATLPPDLSSYQHDLMAEVYRSAPNSSHPVIRMAHTLVTASYRNSWSNMIYELVNSFRATETRKQGDIAFAGYTNLMRRFAYHMDGELWDDAPITAERTKLSFEGVDRDVKQQRFGKDRWALARMLEQALGHPVYVAMIDPDFAVVTPIDRRHVEENPDWYKKAWAVG